MQNCIAKMESGRWQSATQIQKIPYLLYTEVVNHFTAIKRMLKCPSVLLGGS